MPYLYCNIEKHRLGNALFMAASTIGIAINNGMEPRFPSNWKYRQHFNIPDEMFEDCKPAQYYKEPHFHFAVPDFDPRNDTELIGYFQSERYWLAHKDLILQYLTPKGAVPGSIDAVCIHHRRGDYVGNPNYFQLPMAYYIDVYNSRFAGDSIMPFSDDPTYIDLHYYANSLAKRQHADIDEFATMVGCKKHILSNSTFSWWAAYLSQSEQVVCHYDYFAGNLLKSIMSEIKEEGGGAADDLWLWEWEKYPSCHKPMKLNATFIIPAMYDHPDRLENLNATVKFLRENFDCEILIGEINTDKMNADHHYKLPTFHRTKVLNDLTRKAKNDIVFNWDADVVCSPWQIYAAYKAIEMGHADVAYPHDGTFANVPRQSLTPFFKSNDVGVFAGRIWPWMNSSYKSVGGAVGYNRTKFFEAGGENERFISYGGEDQERYMRFQRLGLKVIRVPGTIFHMDHYRGVNSNSRHEHYNNNNQLFEEELARYIAWYKSTRQTDDWRPFSATLGKLVKW